MLKVPYCLCDKCNKRLFPIFQRFKIGKINCLSIYRYNDDLKALIYRFKGCYDYELKDIFVDRFKRELAFCYKGYTVIPVPSSKEDDLKRGFNHVEEIFKPLSLKMDKCIYKSQKIKQSDLKSSERSKVSNYLEIKEENDIKNSNILLVDDICTTGSTLSACINLILTYKPRKLKVLVICKTKDLDI